MHILCQNKVTVKNFSAKLLTQSHRSHFMTRTWIQKPLAIFSEANAENGIVIDNHRIVELIARNHAPSVDYDTVFDARQHVILPGLVNCHHHFYQTLTRALPAAQNKKLFPWLEALYPIWAGLTPEMVRLSSQLALAELMLSGCTFAADHHYLFPPGLDEAIDLQVEAASSIGMRVLLTRGSMSLGQGDGGLPPQSVVQNEQTILDDSERLIRRFHRYEHGAMVQIALAPCSPFSVTPEIMQATAQLSQHFQVRLHTHLAETLDEEAFCLQRFNMRTVDYLESVDWLNERTWLAHGIHFDDEEMQRLGAASVGVCHCPSSNMVLASGICRSLELEKAGSPLGLGVDGSASNDGSNMINEVRQALLIQRLRYGAEHISHRDVLRWATSGGAKTLGRDDVGKIAPGQCADLAFFKLNEARFSGSHDPLAALVLCGATKADRVMVNGEWTVIDGELTRLDLNELIQQHTLAAERLIRHV